MTRTCRLMMLRRGVLGMLLIAVAPALLSCESKTQPPPPTIPAAAAPAAPAAAPAPATAPARPTNVAVEPVAPRTPTGTFLDRPSATVLRVVTYNIRWNSIFADVDPLRAPRFARVFGALDPDVAAMQEIGQAPSSHNPSEPKPRKRTADEVQKLLDQLRPLPGAAWHVYQGGDCVIASKYPLQLTRDHTTPPGYRELALGLVKLPRKLFPADLYLVSTHFKCCGGDENEAARQKQADAIMSWMRDVRMPGGDIDLPAGTALVVAGDFNLVGGQQPLLTVVNGDISDEAQYGPDFAPDWDSTPLTDAHPLHNVTGSADWTWRDDASTFQPGRLDVMVYTDSVLEPVKKLVLDTTEMSAEDLQAAGLEKLDIVSDAEGKDYDHLPLVVDFVFRSGGGAPSRP